MSSNASIKMIAVSMFLASCSPDPNEQVISKAEQAVKAVLKDPDSAQFSDVHIWGDAKVGTVCGRVNAKNSFGGYTGYQRFFSYVGQDKASVESEGDPSQDGFDIMWNGMCAKQTGSSG